MQIILLSGGSGTRLWPLSNDSRSKQFLRVIPKDGSAEMESMVQRVLRQIRETGIEADVTIATSKSQLDAIISQLGRDVDVVTEPERRDTFPAICLAAEYLSKTKCRDRDEVIIVMPCDPYTDSKYFSTIRCMAEEVEKGTADLILMGIQPTYPSSKYGYVVPGVTIDKRVNEVKRFTEKPDATVAKQLMSEGALWNGGVFAFKLGYLVDISKKYVDYPTFEEIRSHYTDYPKISFDYEVAERAESVAVVSFSGEWKDLGTWNTLTDELNTNVYGNVLADGKQRNTHIINELEIPILCLGTQDLIIAASRDGILISDKKNTENIKGYADKLKDIPMYEEKRWGHYCVIDYNKRNPECVSITKKIFLKPEEELKSEGTSQVREILTIIEGEGIITFEGGTQELYAGAVLEISSGSPYIINANTLLVFISVQFEHK